MSNCYNGYMVNNNNKNKNMFPPFLVVFDADVRGEGHGGAALILTLVTVVFQSFIIES